MPNLSQFSSTSSTECKEHSALSPSSTVPGSLIFYAGLGVIGVVGNAHVILVFRSSRERSLRFLVLFLSYLDLLISGVVLPLDLYRIYAEYLTEGRMPWHFLGTVILSSRQAAFELEGCVLVLIAVDRFLCVVKARRDGLSYRHAVTALLASGVCVVVIETGNVATHYVIEEKCAIKARLESYLLIFYGALSIFSIVLVAALYGRILSFVAAIERRRSSRRELTRRTLRSFTRRSGGGGRRWGASSAFDSSLVQQQQPQQQPPLAWEEVETGCCDVGGDDSSCGVKSGVLFAEQPHHSSVHFSVESEPATSTAISTANHASSAATLAATSAATSVTIFVSVAAPAADDFSEDAEVDAVAASAPYGRATWFPLRLALMLFGATVLFYLSLLPGILINFSIMADSPLHRLYYMNSSLNFAVYALLNPRFRSDLKGLYSRHCCTAR